MIGNLDSFGPEILLSLLAGILTASAVAKIVAHAKGTLAWPHGQNFLLWHVPLAVVVVGELLVGIAFLAATPVWFAGAILGVSYALMAAAAGTLRGRECACFGIEGMRVGPAHVIVNVTGAFTAGTIAVVARGEMDIRARSLYLLSSTIVALTCMTIAQTHLRKTNGGLGTCVERGARIEVMTSPDCAACAALRMMLESDFEAESVTWLGVETKTGADDLKKYAPRARLPCVLVFDERGFMCCSPQEGLPRAEKLVSVFRNRARLQDARDDGYTSVA